ncbi:M16 family metallopeptidase [Solimonas marina]|uniref:Insulinase family protein n=1 Tax=Solimonas marina TaxID=2714601 RepID=A0A970B4J8_9GAMM|nr:pitrilysin family protein [Solimonas marina]NKF20693.1 insulinase family protein [Solimonas marina]
MKRLLLAASIAATTLLSALPAAAATQADAFPDVHIPYTRYQLPNGLTVIIHEDHKAPVVAVNVWYHVGSKDEPAGLHGFAHLFEHLMFNGSEHYNDEFFRALEPAGATKMNGTTSYDRTNYFENVPTSALDRTLWLESDRMGHLLGAIDQKRLDEQRGVVLNEKRQDENKPYGKVDDIVARDTYPSGHPYSWTPIGSEKDLNTATLDDVKNWFRTHYGAANATLVIAGDVDTEAVKKKIALYFGDIPSGPPVDHAQAWVAKMHGTRRETIEDRVPQARLYEVWNIPGFCDPDANMLSMVASVLGDGKNSRLYKRLVYQDQIATDVDVSISPTEIGSQLTITATVKPGGDEKALERAIDEEMARFLKDGPSKDEVSRVQTAVFASALRGLERIDGFGGKSAMLAQYQVYCGTPDRYTQELDEIKHATPDILRTVARKWLSDGVFKLDVEPFPDYTAAKTGADRSQLPALGSPPALTLPPLQHATLSNGLKIALAERHEAPIVHFSLIANAGYAADSDPDVKAGTARLTLAMLDEGAGRYDALQLDAAEDKLGALIGGGSTLDTSYIGLNALKAKLKPSLDLYADIILRPTFPAHELERLKQLQMAAIEQEKARPIGIARRLYTRLLYGPHHAYTNPASGTGTTASVASIDVSDLQAFYHRWLRPDNATLLVVGDTTMDEIMPLLEKEFGSWKAPDTPVPQKNLAHVDLPTQPKLVMINKRDAPQTLIMAAELAPPKSDPDDLAMQLASTVLGGNFVSRLNMNLREDKHWSYGAFTGIGGAKAQRPFFAYAPVQTDKTTESMTEIQHELDNALGAKPLTGKEIDFARNSIALALPSDNETASDLASSYATVLADDLPDDYWNQVVPKLDSLSPADVNAALHRLVHPQALTWIVIGDLSKIEAPVRKLAPSLGIHDIEVLDADGHPVADDGT